MLSQLEGNDSPVKRRTWPLRYWKALAGVGVFVAVTMLAFIFVQPGIPTVDSRDMSIAVVTRQQFAPMIRINGRAVPTLSAAITAPEGGIVARVHRSNGDILARGQVLVELENPSLVRDVAAERLRLASQMADIMNQQSQITRQTAEADRAERETQYRLEAASRTLERQEQLGRNGFASGAALEAARAERQFAAESLDSVRTSARAVRSDGRLQAGRLAAARATLLQLDRMQLRRLEALRLRAPLAGNVSGLRAFPGSPVAAAEVVARIEDGDQMELAASLPEARQSQIRVGVRAMAELPGAAVGLEVISIDSNVVDGQISIRLKFVGEMPSTIRAGQSIYVGLITGERREALVIPATALTADNEVFILTGDRAKRVPVQLGERSGALVEVLGGLTAGQRIISTSSRSLESHRAIRISP